MIKRILPLVFAVALMVCLAFPVFAEDTVVNGRTVVNYLDYVKAYDFSNLSEGWAYISFDQGMFTSYKQDSNGYSESLSGSRVWNLKVPNDDEFSTYVVSQVPGGYINSTFLDLSNIPSGSKFWIQAIADTEGIEGYQTEFALTINSGVTYFDENFNKISDDFSEQDLYYFGNDERISQIVEITFDKPENAKYCTLYTICNIKAARTNDQDLDFLNISFQFSEPNLKISTTYIQVLIDSIIASKKPVGFDSIVDADELEDYLKDQISDGKIEFDSVIDQSPDAITLHVTGFYFMADVIDCLASAGWINGILLVSISLGVFGFVANLGISLGRVFERRSGGGGKT